jgi:hypothetical protein
MWGPSDIWDQYKKKKWAFKGFSPKNKKAMAQKIEGPKLMIGPFR